MDTGPLPPFVRVPRFLPENDRLRLLQWTLNNSDRFRDATVTVDASGDQQVNPDTRVALTCRDIGSELDWLRERLAGAREALLKGMGAKIPPVESIELEVAAHGDGAHFAPHLDIPVGRGRKPLGGRPGHGHDRLLSAVYYFYGEPKGFTGGSLRLYRFGSSEGGANDPANFVELKPDQNLLIAFPPWVRHEVRPVSCPSGQFRDYRLAVNCWYCGKLKSQSPLSQ